MTPLVGRGNHTTFYPPDWGRACGDAGKPSTSLWEEKYQKINIGYLWVVRSQVAFISFFFPCFHQFYYIAWVLKEKNVFF